MCDFSKAFTWIIVTHGLSWLTSTFNIFHANLICRRLFCSLSNIVLHTYHTDTASLCHSKKCFLSACTKTSGSHRYRCITTQTRQSRTIQEKPALTGLTGCPLSSLCIQQHQCSQCRRGDRLRRTETGPCHQPRHAHSPARCPIWSQRKLESLYDSVSLTNTQNAGVWVIRRQPCLLRAARPTALKSPLAFSLL